MSLGAVIAWSLIWAACIYVLYLIATKQIKID
jgi:hypothetical protein